MARLFLETSALAKRYIREKGTPRLLQLIGNADAVVVSALAYVEVTSAAVRRANAGDLSVNDLAALLQTLESDFCAPFDVIELDAPTITQSVESVKRHALRAADGIQLACALIAAAGSTDESEFVFVSSDHELNAAARAEGLNVVDPAEV